MGIFRDALEAWRPGPLLRAFRLLKSASGGHKYLWRTWDGANHRWRYHYTYGSGRGLAHPGDVVHRPGAEGQHHFSGMSRGLRGYWDVVGQQGQVLHLRHSESGVRVSLSAAALRHRLIKQHHQSILHEGMRLQNTIDHIELSMHREGYEDHAAYDPEVHQARRLSWRELHQQGRRLVLAYPEVFPGPELLQVRQDTNVWAVPGVHPGVTNDFGADQTLCAGFQLGEDYEGGPWKRSGQSAFGPWGVRPGHLSLREVGGIEEVVQTLSGFALGEPIPNTPAIDGWFKDGPVFSLKQAGSLTTVRRNITGAVKKSKMLFYGGQLVITNHDLDYQTLLESLQTEWGWVSACCATDTKGRFIFSAMHLVLGGEHIRLVPSSVVQSATGKNAHLAKLSVVHIYKLTVDGWKHLPDMTFLGLSRTSRQNEQRLNGGT